MADQYWMGDALRLYLTGASSDGGAQADPDLALGKNRSSSRVDESGYILTSPFSNITVDFVSAENGTGSGTLTAASSSALTWTPNGSTQGDPVAIANGETKVVFGPTGEEGKFVLVTRNDTDDLLGSCTVKVVEVFNNVIGLDNVASAEASAGDTEYRAVMIGNGNPDEVRDIEIYLDTLGTAQVSDTTQLGAGGAGTIVTTGTLVDWPASGYCRIEDNGDSVREIVYYSSRNTTTLTVPATGRGLLGTGAGAGAGTDNIYAVPGLRFAIEAPASQPSGAITDKTGAGEGSQPGGLTWKSGIRLADGATIAALPSGHIYGLWLERQAPASMVATPSLTSKLVINFDTRSTA